MRATKFFRFFYIVCIKCRMKTRINISIGEKIHSAAKKYAAARDMDFSELLAYLLRRELETPSISAIGESPKSKPAKGEQVSATAAPIAPRPSGSTSTLSLNESTAPPSSRLTDLAPVRYGKPAKKKA